MIQKNKFTETPHKEWKPRNKQAALVVSKSSWIHQAPHEPEKAVRLPTPEEEHIAYRNELRRKIEEHDAEKARRASIKAKQPQKPAKPKKQKCMWAAKLLKNLHRQRGLPPPTTEEIQAYRKAQPNYGKPA